ncbi:MAG: molecular chaperone DnaJ [Corynebacterium sp.]|nr:molecular chaperone DnaJ [Corynebacterium sp.]
MMSKSEWIDKDYYAYLGVDKNASQADIKKAYRKIARENHPDTNPGDAAAEERFKKAAEAYDVVGDPETRREYDQVRSMPRGFGGAGFGGGSGAGGFNGNINMNDLFNGGFGGAAGAGGLGDILGGIFNRGSQQRRPSRGADVEVDLSLSFKEAVLGGTTPVELSTNVACSTCHGSGDSSGLPTTCSTCHGEGLVQNGSGVFNMAQPCPDCGGTGHRISNPCPDCQGRGVRHSNRTVRIRVPSGVVDGQRIRVAGQGEAGPNGIPSGDLFVTVHVRPDALFTRQGNDLAITVPVSFSELALGGTIEVPTLEKTITVRIPAGTPNGRTLRVRGRGVPRKGRESGDLLVTVTVKVPENLSEDAKSALGAYAEWEKNNFDPRAGWGGNRG